MSEPRLRAEDHRLWESWRLTALHHAKTRKHDRAVDDARRAIGLCLDQATTPAVMWSGGKDSTVMTHLVCADLGARVPVFSEKDDLDYPGEEDYIARLGSAWGLDLRIIRPPVSPSAWMAENAHKLGGVGADLHSRAAGLSKACFYEVVEAATAGFDGVFLGLRAEESGARRVDRATHTTVIDGRTERDIYRYASGPRAGTWKCQPLGGWTGLDVMAYLAAHDIEPLHVYRCIAFMHAREPWRIRKSWWVPEGRSGLRGGIAWLKWYFPSLYAKLCSWMPDARTCA